VIDIIFIYLAPPPIMVSITVKEYKHFHVGKFPENLKRFMKIS